MRQLPRYGNARKREKGKKREAPIILKNSILTSCTVQHKGPPRLASAQVPLCRNGPGVPGACLFAALASGRSEKEEVIKT